MTEPTKDQQDNWHLCNVIREYHEAYMAVLEYTQRYVDSGGDRGRIPAEWVKLDQRRDLAYQAMIKAAGIEA